MSDRRKRSNVWLHFSALDNEKAKCAICSIVLSIRGGSTSNLGKHLKLKHVSVVDGILPKKSSAAAATTTAAETSSFPLPSTVTSSCAAAVSTSTSTPVTHGGSVTKSTVEKTPARRLQHTLSEYVVRPVSVSPQKRLNKPASHAGEMCANSQNSLLDRHWAN